MASLCKKKLTLSITKIYFLTKYFPLSHSHFTFKFFSSFFTENLFKLIFGTDNNFLNYLKIIQLSLKN